MPNKVGLSPDEAVSHAAEHLRKGNSEQASRISQMILDAAPGHAGASNILGVVFLNNGDFDKAVAYFRAACEGNDQKEGFWFNLGLAYLNTNERKNAIEAFEKCVTLNPNQDIARSHLVDQYIHTGQYQGALDLVQNQLKDKPDDINSLILLERISLEMGRYNLAHRTLKKLLELMPEGEVELKLEIASLFIMSNFPGRAKHWIDEVLALAPDNKRALWVYGEMLQQSGLTKDAIGYFEKAVEGVEVPLSTKITLATAYIELNRKSEAKKIIDGVLDKNPQFVPAYLLAAQVQEDGLSPDQIDRIEKIAENFGEDNLCELQNIEYALATTAAAQKRYSESFQHYRKANIIHKKILEDQKRGYNRALAEKKFQQVKAIFKPELIERLSCYGNPSKIPVFIAGMPRSGTTLTEQIIGAHSKAAGVGELMDIPHLGILIREFTGNKKEYPLCVPDLDAKYISALANGYLNRLTDWQPGAQRIVNKLPGNFLFLGLIRILFPNAPIIHCVRDPRDTLISCFMERFGPGLSYSFDLDDAVHQYELYRDLMDYWEKIFSNTMYQSFYGDLVTKPEESIKNLLAYCDLDYEAGCLDFHSADTTVRTASLMQVRKPIYTSSVERWRRYEGQIDEIMHLRLPEQFQNRT